MDSISAVQPVFGGLACWPEELPGNLFRRTCRLLLAGSPANRRFKNVSIKSKVEDALSNANNSGASDHDSRDSDATETDQGKPGNSSPASKKSDPKSARVSWASPRFWHGMRFLPYMRLLSRGGFRIHFRAIGMAIALLFYSIGNSFLSFVQWLFLGRKIEKTKIEFPPIFIVGHWRTGTTLVHELLSLDEQLATPSTYQCFAPSHFLITERSMKPLVAMVMPKTRPMDNMATGPDRPNEDEFAYCALGAPSPYMMLAFPNQPRPYQELIDMKDAEPHDVEAFRASMLFFAKSLTCKSDGKRLLLKSPTHTGRLEFLRKLFPGAKFLHICRDPKSVIPSTVRLWTRLEKINGFQIPQYDLRELEDYVGDTFSRLDRAFEDATSENDDDVFTLHYEDVVVDPVEQLKKAYERFGLEGFDKLEPKLRAHMESQSDYQKNEHQVSERLRQLINKNCAAYQQKYGYDQA